MAIQAPVTSRGQSASTIEELGALDLFHGLPLHDLEAIQDVGNCLLFGRGETIVAITQGTVMAYVLLEGRASAYRFGPTGLKLEIERLSPGHLYLRACQDDELDQQDVIEAVGAETRVLRLPAATIHALLASRCSVGAALSAQGERQRSALAQRLEDASLPIRVRLCRQLVRGERQDPGHLFTETQEEWSWRIHCQREEANRAIRMLARNRTIEQQQAPRGIIVLDLVRLIEKEAFLC